MFFNIQNAKLRLSDTAGFTHLHGRHVLFSAADTALCGQLELAEHPRGDSVHLWAYDVCIEKGVAGSLSFLLLCTMAPKLSEGFCG